jgi:hypothetical protein
MATTTPNYGWPVPTSTDYVKDGATAIEALGDAIDATLFGIGGNTKISQVISTTKTDVFSMSSSTFADVTGLTATVTPSSATSKVLVIVSGIVGHGGTNERMELNLRRGSTNIGQATGGTSASTAVFLNSGEYNESFSITFLDSPTTTSATTYGLQMATQNGTAYIGRLGVSDRRGSTTITVMEVLA